jgi:glycosyltransferase involved in cell wall biosynthesis
MMMGKPVVSTRVLSLGDIVEEGVTGFLVEPQDVAAMRGAILYLLDHPEEVAKMGATARQRYEERHSFEQFARSTYQTLLQVYRASQQAS